MKRHRIERHETLIHQVINEYLIRDGKTFLKKEFVNIMGIKLSPDLSIALIYISALDNSRSDFVEKVMYERKKDIKNYISRSIGKKIRKIPDIKFIIDSTEHEASRINKILSNLNTSSKK